MGTAAVVAALSTGWPPGRCWRRPGVVGAAATTAPTAPSWSRPSTKAAGEGTIIAPATGDVAAAADRFPWVASVSVSRDWPRGMAVHVTEATPAAVASFGDQAVLVSAQGRVLGPREGTPGIGWLRLEVAPPPAGADIPDGARPALALIASADPEVGSRIRALRVGADGTWVGRLSGGPELRLGSGSAWRRRPRRSGWCWPISPRRTRRRRPTSTSRRPSGRPSERRRRPIHSGGNEPPVRVETCHVRR